MRVDFEYLESLYAEIGRIDKHPFDKIQFYRKGKKLRVTAYMRKRWPWINSGNSKFFRYYDLLRTTPDRLIRGPTKKTAKKTPAKRKPK